MPSSYTSSLRLTLPVQGELSGSWGNTVNTGITQLVDAAVAGAANITMTAADYILTSNTGAADEARAMFLVLGGTPGAARNVICPAVSKLYYVTNNTTGGFAQTVKTSAGTGISVPNGASMVLRCDGTNVVEALNAFGSLTINTGKVVLPNTQSYAIRANSGASCDVVTLTSGNVLQLGGGGATDSIQFWNQGLQRMTLDSSGNLGIGTTSPAQRLDVVTTSATVAKFTRDLATDVSLTIGADNDGAIIGTDGVNVMRMFTGGSERARITSAGDLLMGLSAATFVSTRLEVQAATNNNGLGSKTTQNNYAPLMAWNSATTGDNLFQYFYTEGTLTLRGSITYNRAGGLVAYNTTSDYRAKDIIGPVQNPGATIDALKVYEGKMKGATQSRPMLIAHEAQAVAPYCVTGEKDAVNEDGAPIFQQMDVSSLVPLLLAEIQSLRARVAALEAA